MSATRLFSCAALVLLFTAGPTWAAAPALEFAVKKPHLLFGASHGTLIFTVEGVDYKTTDKKDARHWGYEQIKQVQVLSPTRLAVRTYEEHGWTRLWADRAFTFEIEKGQFTPDLSAFLLATTPRTVVTAVLPQLTGTPRYRIPVKHVRGRGGSEGELVLFSDALVYQSPQPGASRYWRFGDISSMLPLDRDRLDITTFEGGAGETRPFVFQLKTDVPAGFYDTLWAAVNPPAPLRGTAPATGMACCGQTPSRDKDDPGRPWLETSTRKP